MNELLGQAQAVNEALFQTLLENTGIWLTLLVALVVMVWNAAVVYLNSKYMKEHMVTKKDLEIFGSQVETSLQEWVEKRYVSKAELWGSAGKKI